MKDYCLRVNFNNIPTKPYEWDNTSCLVNPKVIRVLPKVIKDILLYDCYINTKDKTFVLSDSINSLVVRLDKNNKVMLRSFLLYEDELNLNEYVSNIKRTNLEYKKTNKKIINNKYSTYEEDVKDYLIKSINDMEEDKLKYMYYLFFDNIKHFSKEKLIKSISNNKSNKLYKLYNFLIRN